MQIAQSNEVYILNLGLGKGKQGSRNTSHTVGFKITAATQRGIASTALPHYKNNRKLTCPLGVGQAVVK